MRDNQTIIRFPLERRRPPLMHALHDVAPDAREVGNIIDAMRLPPIGDPRAEADKAAAGVIAKSEWPEAEDQRQAALDDMLKTYVDQAIATCSLASDAEAEAAAAIDAARLATYYHGSPDAPTLEKKADRIIYKAAWLTVQAFIQCKAAQGVARAVDYSKRREPWSERTVQQDTDWLCNAERRFMKC
jgi:hypothetical protein